VHESFEVLLNSIVAKKEVMNLYEEVLRRTFSKTQNERINKMKVIEREVDKNNSRVSKATQMMLDTEMDMSEYRSIKSEYEQKNKTLFLKRASLELEKVDYRKSIQGSFNLLRDLEKFYSKASVDIKQKLVGLMFTEKLIFQKDGFRTPKMNEVLSLIMMNDNNLQTQKKGSKKNLRFSPHW
jgi:site-specific DNA recombinase